jgi:hypothetical protein
MHALGGWVVYCVVFFVFFQHRIGSWSLDGFVDINLYVESFTSAFHSDRGWSEVADIVPTTRPSPTCDRTLRPVSRHVISFSAE